MKKIFLLIILSLVYINSYAVYCWSTECQLNPDDKYMADAIRQTFKNEQNRIINSLQNRYKVESIDADNILVENGQTINQYRESMVDFVIYNSNVKELRPSRYLDITYHLKYGGPIILIASKDNPEVCNKNIKLIAEDNNHPKMRFYNNRRNRNCFSATIISAVESYIKQQLDLLKKYSGKTNYDKAQACKEYANTKNNYLMSRYNECLKFGNNANICEEYKKRNEASYRICNPLPK